jgi:hypothetical protein
MISSKVTVLALLLRYSPPCRSGRVLIPHHGGHIVRRISLHLPGVDQRHTYELSTTSPLLKSMLCLEIPCHELDAISITPHLR